MPDIRKKQRPSVASAFRIGEEPPRQGASTPGREPPGQGAYTPWQMFAYGAGGMRAGFLFAKGRLPKNRWVMAAFGFLTCVCFVGPLLDTCSAFLSLSEISPKAAWPFYASGFPVNCTQAVCTFLTLMLIGKPFLEKLDRVRRKFGMTEA